LYDLKELIDPTTELVTLLESYQGTHHYPDFLRIYNSSGLNKLMRYIELNKQHITNFLSIIHIYEINSSHIFNSVKILYKNPDKFQENIHFDNKYLEDYLYNKNYPVLKIKKMLSSHYKNNEIPNDFVANEYRNINSDLSGFSDNEALRHFINNGMKEGRFYKKTQPITLPPFLENYINSNGLNLLYNVCNIL
jgi:hypothetical protein